jgi:hypothetical protein
VLRVAVEGFGEEDSRVASRTVGVAVAEGAEEFGEEFIGSLWGEESQYINDLLLCNRTRIG